MHASGFADNARDGVTQSLCCQKRGNKLPSQGDVTAAADRRGLLKKHLTMAFKGNIFAQNRPDVGFDISHHFKKTTDLGK